VRAIAAPLPDITIVIDTETTLIVANDVNHPFSSGDSYSVPQLIVWAIITRTNMAISTDTTGHSLLSIAHGSPHVLCVLMGENLLGMPLLASWHIWSATRQHVNLKGSILIAFANG